MSVPARKVPPSTPGRKPASHPAPARRRLPERGPAPRPTGRHPHARRAAPVGFLLLATALAVVAILGLVSLNAFLAQNQFRIERLSNRIETLAERNGELQREAAHLSAPGRVATWARRNGMRLPDDPHILHVGAAGSDDPAGAGFTGDVGGLASGVLDAEALAVKSVLEGVR